MLTTLQRTIIRESWAKVVPIADTAADQFYRRLFELDPALRSLFAHADMAAQGKKLVQMLDVVVAQLDRPDVLLPAVAALGRRHAGYGVRDTHFAVVGEALLWTLERGLGDAWTVEARDAWTAAYTGLAEQMRRATAALSSDAA
jgi:hemoglobin-like flavoprotein